MRERKQGEVRGGESCAHGVSGAGPARTARCACHTSALTRIHVTHSHTHAADRTGTNLEIRVMLVSILGE